MERNYTRVAVVVLLLLLMLLLQGTQLIAPGTDTEVVVLRNRSEAMEAAADSQRGMEAAGILASTAHTSDSSA